MAAVTTVAAPLDFGSDIQRAHNGQLTVTPFDIPNSRIVHGEKFPLGLELKSVDASVNIDTAVQKIEELAQAGAFQDLLANRKDDRNLSLQVFEMLSMMQMAQSSSAASQSPMQSISRNSCERSNSPIHTTKSVLPESAQ